MSAYNVMPGKRRPVRKRLVNYRKAHALPGYIRISELPASFSIAWRWRYDVNWHAGSVATHEEAEALRDAIRAALERGDEPGPMSRYDVRNGREDTAGERLSAAELAERRARLAQQLAPDAVRCARCHCLKPCDPCIDELTREIRSARR